MVTPLHALLTGGLGADDLPPHPLRPSHKSHGTRKALQPVFIAASTCMGTTKFPLLELIHFNSALRASREHLPRIPWSAVSLSPLRHAEGGVGNPHSERCAC